MHAIETFDQALTSSEHRVIASLSTPNKIQAFLDELPFSAETIYRSPLRFTYVLSVWQNMKKKTLSV